MPKPQTSKAILDELFGEEGGAVPEGEPEAQADGGASLASPPAPADAGGPDRAAVDEMPETPGEEELDAMESEEPGTDASEDDSEHVQQYSADGAVEMAIREGGEDPAAFIDALKKCGWVLKRADEGKKFEPPKDKASEIRGRALDKMFG